MHTQPNQVTRALVLVDLQEFDVDPTVGSLASQGPEAQAEYLDTIKSRVLPSALEALRCAREAKIEVVHVRIQSLTHDGRERSPAHKRLGIHVAPGSVHSRFLKGLEPLDDELIFNKTTSDAFHSTSLAYVLRNCLLYTSDAADE